MVSQALGDRGLIPRHEDYAALRVHQGADAAHREAGARRSRLGVQPLALCHRQGESSGATARNSQHGGCGNVVHLDHPNAVRRPKIARKSIHKACRRSRGGHAGETDAEKLRAGRQATSKALSSADKAAFGISPGGSNMSLKLAAFGSKLIDIVALI